MKKNLFFAIVRLILALFIISSCTKDEFNTKNHKPEGKHTQNKFCEGWDESYHHNVNTRLLNESYEFVPVIPNNVYTGMILNGEKLNTTGKIVPIIEKVDPLGLVFTVSNFYISRLQHPNYTSYMQEFKKALNDNNFSGQQIEEFEYDLKQFSKYSEMKLAFGTNVDICSIFKLWGNHESNRIRHKTGLFARICQKNFNGVIDYPEDGNIFSDNNKLSIYPNAAYISSISYGRIAIIAIESDYSYEEVKSAFKMALNAKKINGVISMDAHAKDLLLKADICIWVRGGVGGDIVKTITGFNEFTNFIVNGGTFTRDVPGKPIFCTANRADDNSALILQFDINEK